MGTDGPSQISSPIYLWFSDFAVHWFIDDWFGYFIGTSLGAVAGYNGGWWNIGIMRVMDVLLAFPVLLLALAVVAVLGPGLRNTFIAVTVVQIPHFPRITRASVHSLKETEFVEASRALGGGYFHILLDEFCQTY